jgi:hypothetical protein
MVRSQLLLLISSLVVLMLAGSRVGEGAKPKVANLAACPAWGSEKRGTTRALLNEVKHHLPREAPPVLLEFNDMTPLQQEADVRVKSGVNAEVTAKDRAKLRDLAVRSNKVGEGDPVAMPVIRFLACQRPDDRCDPSREEQWQPLESIPDR